MHTTLSKWLSTLDLYRFLQWDLLWVSHGIASRRIYNAPFDQELPIQVKASLQVRRTSQNHQPNIFGKQPWWQNLLHILLIRT